MVTANRNIVRCSTVECMYHNGGKRREQVCRSDYKWNCDDGCRKFFGCGLFINWMGFVLSFKGSGMTTVAYRDGILAVDRQMCHGAFIRPTDMKMCLIKPKSRREYALAFTGSIIMGLAFAQWIKDGQVRGEFPIKDIDKEKLFHALLVTRVMGGKPTVQYFGNDLIAMSEDEREYVAQGYGDEFAYGAFYMGATAIEAVQAASAQCAWSGFGINYVDVAGDFEIKRWKKETTYHR